MSIAISEEHRALAQTVAGLLTKHHSRAAARDLLDADTEPLPAFWAELGGLGLLGLHVPEELGGSGFGLAETLVVAEQMGRHLAPGPYVPTVIVSAVLAAAGPDELRKRLLPGLVDGSVIGAAALGGAVTCTDGAATGKAGVVLSGRLADVLLVPAGDDVLVIESRPAASRPRCRRTWTRAAGRPGSGSTRPRRRCCRMRAGCSPTWPGPCWRPRRPASPPRPRRWRPSTRRSASSSAARSPPSRRSSTTARTCWWPPSSRPPPCGTPRRAGDRRR